MSGPSSGMRRVKWRSNLCVERTCGRPKTGRRPHLRPGLASAVRHMEQHAVRQGSIESVVRQDRGVNGCPEVEVGVPEGAGPAVPEENDGAELVASTRPARSLDEAGRWAAEHERISDDRAFAAGRQQSWVLRQQRCAWRHDPGERIPYDLGSSRSLRSVSARWWPARRETSR
jgi:hypothetical protein